MPRLDEHEKEVIKREFNVDAVYAADLPDWWCRLTAPICLDWRREAGAFVGVWLFGILCGVVLAGLAGGR
jgi:hypothetical protein